MPWDAFRNDAREYAGVELRDRQLEQFRIYLDMLLEWNAHTNLTAIRDQEGIISRHFLDSLTVIKATGPLEPGMKVADIGTGAGFPGLPLKILYPEIKLMLLDSVKKKCRFLDEVAREIDFYDVKIVHARVEDAGWMPEHREAYDWVIARALAYMPVLAEYLLPLVRVGGKMLAQKGERAHDETAEAANAIKTLGGKLDSIEAVDLPGVESAHHLVVVSKNSPTSDKFPRQAGTAKRQPL